MTIPTNLKYAKSHEWARLEADGTVTIGITAHAQDLLGDMVFVENPATGRKLAAGEECAVVESVKAASDVYAPLAGEVIAANAEVEGSPEKINQDAPENLLESELFGYARGAHSTANTDRQGLFVEADGGTLFLDEIAELPLSLQPKLLRVLQDGEVRPLGTNRAERADVRVIAATNRDLERALREGRFREDLYYRLNVIQLHLPPLRGRQDDILALADHFLLRSVGRSAKPVRGWKESAKKLLLAYHWPGNVRELENVVERAVALAEGEFIGPDDLPRALQERRGQDLLSSAVAQGFTLDQLEREFIERVLELEGGNKTRTAQRLGLDRKTLYRKLEEYASSPRNGAPPPANGNDPDASGS
jgi:glycine cleavage system H protein